MPLSVFAPFITKRPGNEQGRVGSSTEFEPTEGDFAVCLGGVKPGASGRFNPADKIELFQDDTYTPGKVLRFRSRMRGPSKMPAASVAGPFALVDGQTLQLSIDEGATQIITFNTGDFVAIGAALSAEVVAVINAQVTGATAILAEEDVAIFSDDSGRKTGVRPVGGTAQGALKIAELAWFARFKVDGVTLVSREIVVGETRDFSDIAANLADAADPAEMRFSLELVRK